jgi:hypothetical protein
MKSAPKYVYQLDFHYHAGSERSKGTTCFDYLDHARMTGRLMVGVTDHLERYDPKRIRNPYGPGAEGLRLYMQEIREAAGRIPNVTFLFSPEVSAERVDELLTAEIAEMADCLILEPPRIFDSTDVEKNTRDWIAGIKQSVEVRRKYNTPGHMPHPFRESSNLRVIEKPIEPWITDLEPRPDCDFPEDLINEFFMIDVRALGRALAEHDLPSEISGDTNARITRINLPVVKQLLWAGYRILHEEGVDLVPGSDQHVMLDGIGRVGTHVPADVYDWLGLTARDIRYWQELCPDLAATSLAGAGAGDAD